MSFLLSGGGTPPPLKVCKVRIDKDLSLDFDLASSQRTWRAEQKAGSES